MAGFVHYAVKNSFMQKENNEQFNTDNIKKDNSRNNGAQGIDKAPGEETAENVSNFKSENLQDKKVDADLTQPNERQDNRDI